MNKEKYEDVVNDEQFYQEIDNIIEKAKEEGNLSKEDRKKLDQKFNLLISYNYYCYKKIIKELKKYIKKINLAKKAGYNIDNKSYDTICECYYQLQKDIIRLSDLKKFINLIYKNKQYYILDNIVTLFETIILNFEEACFCIEDIKDASYNNTEYNHLSHVRYRRSHSYVTTIYEWIINELGYNQTKVKKR